MMVQTVTVASEGIMIMTLLYHEEGRKLSKAEGSERVLCTASPVTWSRDKKKKPIFIVYLAFDNFAINYCYS